MEFCKLKFDGPYDSRTLLELKRNGIDHFSFDFNPISFNFIQERVFLDLFDKILNETDKIFLHFHHNKDFMIHKIREEILKRRGSLDNIFFEFDEFISDVIIPDDIKFYILYQPSVYLVSNYSDNLIGFIFSYDFLYMTYRNSQLTNFYSNFLSHFKTNELDKKIFILKLDWNESVNKNCLDIFDFEIISLPLNSEVEVCYRNIDLNKLKCKIDSKRVTFKNQIKLQGF